MDSANLEEQVSQIVLEDKPKYLKQIKKPKIRKNKPSDPSTDKRRKENREPTEKQLAARFKNGNAGNTARRTMREHQKLYRQNMAMVASSVIPEMLVNTLYDVYQNPDYDPSNLMQVVKFITEQAFGRASEWVDYENESTASQTTLIPAIQINMTNGTTPEQLSAIDVQYIESGNIEDDDSIGDSDDN